MSVTFHPSDAFRYHSYQELEEKFLELNAKNPPEMTLSEREVKDRIPTTFWGKNISNVIGYIPLIATVGAVFKFALLLFLKAELSVAN